jgi:hypothetical protein
LRFIEELSLGSALVVGAFELPGLMFAFYSPTIKVMGRWCTVTVTDEKGQRHSLDIQAESTFDAAHLYVSAAKSQAAAMLPNRVPVPTLATIFEIIVDGKVYTVKGAALQRWIVRQRSERKGPKGFLFSQRPALD